MAILLKANYRFNGVPIKIPTKFFIEFERTILNLIWKNKKSRRKKQSQTIKELLKVLSFLIVLLQSYRNLKKNYASQVTGIKTDTLINGLKLKTQTQIHMPMDTLLFFFFFLRRNQKYTLEKKDSIFK